MRVNGMTEAELRQFFSSWTVPIYYADGRVGYANEEVAIGIAAGYYNFGARLSPEDNERFKPMARGRKPKQASQAAALIEALNFVKVATNTNSVLGDNAAHVRLAGNMVVGFDGQLAAGHPIAEELNLCPHIEQLTKALARSGKTLVISETDGGRLSVKGEAMRAFVQCLPAEALPPMGPDPHLAPADDKLKAAFKVCGVLAKEGETRVIGASLLLRGGDCTGTNGAAMLQCWHGVDLPPNMVLPKVFCQAVAQCPAKLEGFGASFNADNSVNSVTFYFEGGAWLKTICYADKWPDIDGLWWQANYGPVPAGLFEAIDAVADFNPDGFVTFADNAVWSHTSPNVGAQYDVPGLQGGKSFAGKLSAQVAPYAAQIDLTTYEDRAFFIGGEADTPVRGIIMGVRANTHEVAEPEPEAPAPAPEPRQEAPAAAGGWSSPAEGDGWSQPAPAAGGFAIDDNVQAPDGW